VSADRKIIDRSKPSLAQWKLSVSSRGLSNFKVITSGVPSPNDIHICWFMSFLDIDRGQNAFSGIAVRTSPGVEPFGGQIGNKFRLGVNVN
jgi:hypothetical protein